VFLKDIYTIKLTFNGLTGQCSSLKSITFSSEWENTVLQWLFKLKSAPTIAEMWELKGLKQMFKQTTSSNLTHLLCRNITNFMLSFQRYNEI